MITRSRVQDIQAAVIHCLFLLLAFLSFPFLTLPTVVIITSCRLRAFLTQRCFTIPRLKSFTPSAYQRYFMTGKEATNSNLKRFLLLFIDRVHPRQMRYKLNRRQRFFGELVYPSLGEDSRARRVHLTGRVAISDLR